MSNIYEILEKVTPGPWHWHKEHNPKPDYCTSWDLDSPTRGHMATMKVMDINSNPQWRAEHPEVMVEHLNDLAEVDANAQFIAHCCNNYMKALEALVLLHADMEDLLPARVKKFCLPALKAKLDAVAQTIAELQTVECRTVT